MRLDLKSTSLKEMEGPEMAGKIIIAEEAKKEMIQSIKTYFLKERDEDLGDLAAYMIFEFFLETLAPHAYNQGVYDAYKYINDKSEDLLGYLK
jgi:uncharacterized protein (DUF2164 family)